MPEKNENYDEDLNRTSKGIAAKGVKSPMKTLGRLLKYAFLRNKAATVFVVIFVLLSSVATVTAASRVSVIVTALIDGTTSGSWDTQLIYTNIIIMACIYFVGAASSYAYNLIMMYIAQGTLRKMRDDMFATMQTLSLQYFDTHTHGDLMSLYTNDVDTMRQLLTQTIPQLISSVLTLLAVLGFMIYYSVTLLLVVLVVLVGIIIVTKIIGGRSAKYYLANQRALGALNGYVEEMTEGQKVIKVFCHEPNARAGFKEVNDALNEAGSKANAYAFLMGPVNNNLGYLQYVLVAIVGAVIMATVGQPGLLSIYCANSDVTNSMALMAGMLVSYLMYSRQFNMPVQQVSQQFSAIVMALAGAERIFEMIDTAPEDKGGDIVLTHGEVEDGGWAWKKPDGDGTFEYIPLKGDIRFNDVVFGYTPEKVILKNISLYAKPGQKIAFVGSTGAGKTTITNLINRFYDIQSGTITYDGINVKDIKKSDLRRSLGIVLQDTHLFTGTVMDNIRYGRLDASDEECIKAAKLANADSFITHLPEGYNTMIKGDGSNLSQGQRQLLAIARAMVSDCPVLILDEATSSIDTRTEKLIEQGMDKLMEGRTVFVIAHRLSTVRNSHAIMVLDHGRIIERGTHDQLIAQKGVYYQLYTGAFELE
ncbi:MAG TPA: ABC transporter ATP-binding protein [Candidatus Coproplasma stercoripullorum]|uniref:ABC transporter ATP-binding protein n=1 Tax=Candidatus Coproplasma stercoripullorum TaxID=2840751 RepID=A0A9D1AG92_9FIRM|nr:ABC transporter ATP-binding protein [Candidatus Coproplasma stercoripullorum]